MADLLAGAARLSLEPPLDLPLVGFVRQTHDATGYGRLRARDLRDRTRAGRCPRRPLRRRHRRDRRAGDHAAPRPHRRCDRRRACWDPAQLEPHAPLRDGRLLGRRADRAAGARARCPDQELRRRRPGQGRLGLSARVRTPRARPSGVGRRVRRARGQPARARSGTGRRSSAGIRTTWSTTRSRRSSSAVPTRASLRPRSTTAATRSRRGTTCTSTPPTSQGRYGMSCGATPAARPSSSRVPGETSCRRSRSRMTKQRPS